MVILDVAIVNVALPSMRSWLHFSTTGLQWVVNAYTLTFAGFLMLGGRSADLLGRRRVFLTGTALFALSSLTCALANSRGLLIGARGLQGLSGAVLSPATLSIITSSLPEGPGLGVDMDEAQIARVNAKPERRFHWPKLTYADGSVRDY